MEKGSYNHVEAFCLMTYRCKDCGKTEWLWNSRDGVTPFIIGCRYCGGEEQHADWHRDVRVPNYDPKPGERIFVDMTRERAEEIARKRIEYFKKLGYKAPDIDPEERLRDLVEDIWGEGRTPAIIEVPKKPCKLITRTS